MNSLAGFAGLMTNGFKIKTEMGLMIIIAIIGGMAGSYFGVNRYKSEFLNKILAIVLMIASLKLFFT